jgi:hypothetical protein
LSPLSTADLNADARNLQFNPRLPLFFTSIFSVLFSAVSPTLDRNSLSIPVSSFDTLLFADGPRALLPAHAVGFGFGKQRGRGHDRDGDRNRIKYHSHEKILLNWVSLNASTTM